MRVLDTYSGHFVEKDTFDTDHIAIVSHTWDNKGEHTYKQLNKIPKRYDSQYSEPQRNPPPRAVENHQDGLLPTLSLSHLLPHSGPRSNWSV